LSGPLGVAIAQLVRNSKPDRLLIEPSGLGHPAGKKFENNMFFRLETVYAARGEGARKALNLYLHNSVG
jgi:G3E family GTPase